MRKLLIPLAVLVGALSLVGCGEDALTEEQIREIVRDEMKVEVANLLVVAELGLRNEHRHAGDVRRSADNKCLNLFHKRVVEAGGSFESDSDCKATLLRADKSLHIPESYRKTSSDGFAPWMPQGIFER